MYVNEAPLLCLSCWNGDRLFPGLQQNEEGKKISAQLPGESLLPLQPKAQMGVFIVHCTPHLSLQKIIRSESWNCA